MDGASMIHIEQCYRWCVCRPPMPSDEWWTIGVERVYDCMICDNCGRPVAGWHRPHVEGATDDER